MTTSCMVGTSSAYFQGSTLPDSQMAGGKCSHPKVFLSIHCRVIFQGGKLMSLFGSPLGPGLGGILVLQKGESTGNEAHAS